MERQKKEESIHLQNFKEKAGGKEIEREAREHVQLTINEVPFIRLGDLFSGSDITKFTPARRLRFSKVPNI